MEGHDREPESLIRHVWVLNLHSVSCQEDADGTMFDFTPCPERSRAAASILVFAGGETLAYAYLCTWW
jgi:hypothetical protein